MMLVNMSIHSLALAEAESIFLVEFFSPRNSSRNWWKQESER